MDSNTVHWIDSLALHWIEYDRCWLCWYLAMVRLLFYICDMLYWDLNLLLTNRPLYLYRPLVRSNCDTMIRCSIEFPHPILNCIDAPAIFVDDWIQVNMSFEVLRILQGIRGYYNWIFVNHSVDSIGRHRLKRDANVPVLNKLVNLLLNGHWIDEGHDLNWPIWWVYYLLRLHLWFRPISLQQM